MNISILRRVSLLLLLVLIPSFVALSQMRSGKLGVGAGGSLYVFVENVNDGLHKAGGGLNLSYSVMEHLGLRAMLGAGQLGWKNTDAAKSPYTTNMFSGNMYVSFDVLPHSTFNPFLFVGVGGLYFDPRSDDGVYPTGSFNKFDINYLGGVGVDVFFSEFLSMTVSGEGAMANTNMLDLGKTKLTRELYSRVNVEFRYYFFDQAYVTKLIEALQERFKKK
jgi:hypothetical protein